MPTAMQDKYVKCPYYMYSDKRTIICEGLSVHTKLIQKFGHPSEVVAVQQKGDYMKKHCQNKYEECMICAMLNQKYE